MKKILERNNNQGSSLILVMIALMIVGIAVVGFQTSVMSFATRTLTQHYEKQSYLSARSVAEALSEMLEENSYNNIMQLDDSDRNSIVGLPSEMYVGTVSDISLTDKQIQLLEELADMTVGEVIDLGEISFTDNPDELDVGITTATITKDSDSEFIIEATADVNGDVDSVKTLLTAEYYELVTGASADGVVEIDGDWTGFYSDFSVGIASGGYYTINDSSNTIVMENPVYYGAGEDLLGNIYVKNDVTLEDVSLQNGNIKSEGSITVMGDNVFTNGSSLTAAEEINLEAGVQLNLSTLSKTLNITGSGTTLNVGPYVADTINIVADNVTSAVDLQCETLYIKGNNITLGNITANTVIIDGVNIDFTSLTAGQVTIASGSTKTESGKASLIYTGSGTVTYGIGTYAIYGDSGANGVAIAETGFTVTQKDYTTLSNLTSALDDLEIPYRSKPDWAYYEASEIQIYTMAETGGWWPLYESMNSGYYYIADTVGAEIRTETVIENGVATQQDVLWNVIDIETYTSLNWGESLYVIVRDGQNLEVTGGIWSNIYFILEGDAKLYLSTEYSEYATRVYGESVNSTLFNTITSEVEVVVEAAKTAAGNDVTLIDYDAMQLEIDRIMDSYWSSMSGLVLANGVRFTGSAVVPYIKLLGTAHLSETSYTDSSNSLTDEEASVLPEGANTESGGSGGSSSSSGSTVTETFIMFTLDSFIQ